MRMHSSSERVWPQEIQHIALCSRGRGRREADFLFFFSDRASPQRFSCFKHCSAAPTLCDTTDVKTPPHISAHSGCFSPLSAFFSCLNFIVRRNKSGHHQEQSFSYFFFNMQETVLKSYHKTGAKQEAEQLGRAPERLCASKRKKTQQKTHTSLLVPNKRTLVLH